MILRIINSLYQALLMEKRKVYIQKLVNNGLRLGKNVNIVNMFFFDPSHCFLISIGDNCTICPNVRLIAHDASTKLYLGYTKIGKIDVRENCFLGDSVIVLPNVIIGPYSVVGAGSVVTKDIPPHTVAAGNPARVICTLDEYLMKIRTLSASKNIFNENYLNNQLEEHKKKEIIDSIDNSIGFII